VNVIRMSTHSLSLVAVAEDGRKEKGSDTAEACCCETTERVCCVLCSLLPVDREISAKYGANEF